MSHKIQTLSLILSLTICSTVNAIGIQYDEVTGGVTVVGIENQDQFGFYIPAKYSLITRQSDPILRQEDLSRWSAYTNQPGSYLMNYIKYINPHGFDEEVFIGYVMESNIEDIFEDDRKWMDKPADDDHNRYWSSVWERTDEARLGIAYRGMERVNSAVPEPSTLCVVLIGLFGLLLGSKRRVR